MYPTEQPVCRHAHNEERTRTNSDTKIKGWCSECKAFVYTEKSFCICCMKRVSHKTHHLRLKRILNTGIQQLDSIIDEYEKTEFGVKQNELVYCEIIYDNKKYHIPLKYLLMYKQNKINRDILAEMQDHTRIVK